MRPRLLVSFLGLASACSAPGPGETIEWAPVAAEDVNRGTEPGAGTSGEAGAGGEGGSAGVGGSAAGGGPPGGTSGCLTVSFTTVSPKGKYSPRNIGAIWITDANGAYVKTLTVWAGKRAKYLTKWISSSGGDKVDAVTSATLSSHGTRQGVWNCTDKAGQALGNGDYFLNAELTDRDGSGPYMKVPFTFDGNPFDVQMPDEASVPNFTNRHLVHP